MVSVQPQPMTENRLMSTGGQRPNLRQMIEDLQMREGTLRRTHQDRDRVPRSAFRARIRQPNTRLCAA